MKRLAFVLGLLVIDRLAAWCTDGESWLGRLDGGGALLVWGLGHCDTLDGPVIRLARRALDTGNVNLVLPWVREDDEAQIRETFAHAMAVRRLGGVASTLADRHFFETLVRVHRAGEGAAYTGLKPAGDDLGPAVPAADRALEDGSVDKLAKLLTDAMRKGLFERFERALARKAFPVDDVRAGRRYVEAYVPFVHYVERLWQAANSDAHGHHAANAPSAEQHSHHVH